MVLSRYERLPGLVDLLLAYIRDPRTEEHAAVSATQAWPWRDLDCDPMLFRPLYGLARTGSTSVRKAAVGLLCSRRSDDPETIDVALSLHHDAPKSIDQDILKCLAKQFGNGEAARAFWLHALDVAPVDGFIPL
jgi:hypothetical protein